MAIFLDTNALPRQGQLRNVIMSAVLRVAAQRGIDVCLVETVRDESVNARRASVDRALDKLAEALNQASKLVELEPLYLPAPEEVAREWSEDLEQAFLIVAVDGEDAREALVREALRKKPAQGGSGGRDAAIWLTVKRYHLGQPDHTHFVSDNVEDFAAADKISLDESLVAELGDRAVDFHFHRGLDDLLTELADHVQVALTADAIGPALVQDLLPDLVRAALREHSIGDLELGPEDIQAASAVAESVDVLRAYSVEGTGLALVNLVFTVIAGDRVPPTTIRTRAWVEYHPDAGSPTGITMEGEPKAAD